MVDRHSNPQAYRRLWKWGTIATIALSGITLFIAWPKQHPVPMPNDVVLTIPLKTTVSPAINSRKVSIRVYNPDLQHLRSLADGRTVLAMGSEGVLFRSIDDGQTWNHVDTTTHARLVDSAVDPRLGVLTVVGGRGTILHSDATLSSFTRVSVNTLHNFRAIAIGADGKQLAIGDAGIAYLSQDSGQSFHAEKTGSTSALSQIIALPKRARFIIGGDQGKLLLRDEPGAWRSIATAATGLISALSILPDGSLLAGTQDGLLMRSSDDGETWEETSKTRSSAPIIGFKGNSNASIWLARTQSPALFLSSNKGKQFQPLRPEPPQELIEMVWIPGRGFLGVGVDGVTFRADGTGKRWIPESGPKLDGPLAMAILPTTHTLLVVGRSGLIARSTDGGKQYQIVHPGLGGPLRSFADNSPEGGLVVVGRNATVLRSKDEGETWERVPIDIDPTIDLTSIVVDQKTSALLTGGTRGTLLRSIDCARTWTPIHATHENVEFLLASEQAGMFALVNKSAILRSLDAGLTFTPVKMQPGTTLRKIVALSSSDLVAIGDEGRILRSVDKGDRFEEVPSPTNAHLRALAYDPVHRSLWVAGDRGTVLTSRDDGETWTQVSVPTEEDLHVVTLGLNGSQIWFGGNRGTVLHSANTGISFSSLPTGSSHTIHVIVFDPPSKEFFITGVDGTLHQSIEGHLTQFSSNLESRLDAALFYKPTGAMFLGGDRLVRIGGSNP